MLRPEAPRPRPTTTPVSIVATRSVLALIALVAAMGAFGWVADLVVFDGPIGDADLAATRWMADRRTPVFDTLATVGSSLSDTWTVIGAAAGATAMLLAAGHRPQALVLPIGLALELSTFLIVSTVIGRDRPDVDPLGSVPSTASFPSGHVAAAVVLYGGMVLIAASLQRPPRVHRVAIAIAVIIVVSVAVSRVYEGVHHPIDVVGGALLGTGALWAAVRIARSVDLDVSAGLDERTTVVPAGRP